MPSPPTPFTHCPSGVSSLVGGGSLARRHLGSPPIHHLHLVRCDCVCPELALSPRGDLQQLSPNLHQSSTALMLHRHMDILYSTPEGSHSQEPLASKEATLMGLCGGGMWQALTNEWARGVALSACFYNPIPPLTNCIIPSHRGPPATHLPKGLSFYNHTRQYHRAPARCSTLPTRGG